MVSLPTGTVTFLFTDIEGSTRLWEAHPEQMRGALARHDILVRQGIEAAGGVVFKTVGDAFCAVFATVPAALGASVAIQRALLEESWPDSIVIRTRMALHTGATQERDNDYFGPVVNRVSRLLVAGHGGQTLVSAPTCELLRDLMPADVSLEDLGLHRLKDLERPERVYQVVHPDLPETFPTLRTLDRTPNNLPAQLTSFIGREKVLDDVRVQGARTRLLTLTGAGGSGKSRLALQAAAEILERYPEGAWVVELASLSEAGLVPQAVASVLGIKEQSGQTTTETLAEQLKDKQLLLIMDNCEHLIDACGSLVNILLRSCPRLHLLVTSRAPLGIAGEITYRVPSLSLPNHQQWKTATVQSVSHFEAVRLFIERAQFVKPDFAATNANAPAMAQLCYRLDGIPLAIELAAARVRSLAVEQINDKLDIRFRLLTGGDKSALPRQQTLRALVDWSYDLLTEPEKTLLGRLSVFAGGWSLEAAETVCGFDPIVDWEILDLLTSLADKSLVIVEEDGNQVRYRLLETLRQYGVEKRTETGDADDITRRHRDYYVSLAETAETLLEGPEQIDWLNRLETEHDNLRVALACLPETALDTSGLRLVGALLPFWNIRGYYEEGREHVARALALSSQSDIPALITARAKALLCAGRLAYCQGETKAALEQTLEAQRLYRSLTDRQGVALTLNTLGSLASDAGDYDTAQEHYAEALTLNRALGDSQGTANTLCRQGSALLSQGNYAGARALYTEALELYRTLGNKHGMASTLNTLGIVAYDQGRYTQAHQIYTEALARNQELGDKHGMANTLCNLGNVAFALGDYTTAQARLDEALGLYTQLGDKQGRANTLTNLGSVAYNQGNYADAQTRYDAALILFRDLGNKRSLANTLNNLGLVAMEQEDYSQACAHYDAALTLYQEQGNTRDRANTLINLGIATCRQGDYLHAQSLYTEAHHLYQELNNQTGLPYILEGFATIALGQSRPERAVTLWAAATTLRSALSTPLSQSDATTQQSLLTAARTQLGDTAYTAAWHHGQSLTSPQALALALGE